MQGVTVDKLWHTMLLALLVWYYADGQDPYAVIEKTRQLYTKDNVKTREDDSGKYDMRAQCLVALHDAFHQRTLRSLMIVFQRIWHHHKVFTREAYNPKVCLEYYQRWSDWGNWHAELVKPALQDALFAKDMSWRIGFAGDVIDAPGFAAEDHARELVTLDQQSLWTHLRMTFNMLAHVMMYSTIPSSPPWCMCLLLLPDKSQAALTYLKKTHDLILALEASPRAEDRTYYVAMPFLRWVVLREMLELLSAASWSLDHRYGQAALEYAAAIFDGVLTTLGLENGFNDLRDNERRGARHTQRAPDTLSSLSISSQHSRYSGKAPVLGITPDSIGRCGNLHCHPSMFLADQLPSGKDVLGIDAAGIEHGGWPSTSVDAFSKVQLSLFHGLMKTDPSQWGTLWMAGLLQPHMIISDRETGVGSYVIGTQQYTVSLLPLDGVAPSFTLAESSLHDAQHLVPFADMDKVWTGFYTVDMTTIGSDRVFTFTQGDVRSVPEVAARNYIYRYSMAIMQALLSHVGVDHSRCKVKKDLANKVMTHYEVDDRNRERNLSKLDVRARKRVKKKIDEGEGDEDKGEGDEEEEDDDESDEDAAMSRVPPCLRRVAPAEVAFVMSGRVPAGSALNEEETDEALDELSKLNLQRLERRQEGAARRQAEGGGSGRRSSRGKDCVGGNDEDEGQGGAGAGSVEAISAVAAGAAPAGCRAPLAQIVEGHAEGDRGGCGDDEDGDNGEPEPLFSGDEHDVEIPKEAAVRKLVVDRQPAMAHDTAAPPGCKLDQYERLDQEYWVATLPKGVKFKAADEKSKARGSRQKSYHSGAMSSGMARLHCLNWLLEAQASGVV